MRAYQNNGVEEIARDENELFEIAMIFSGTVPGLQELKIRYAMTEITEITREDGGRKQDDFSYSEKDMMAMVTQELNKAFCNLSLVNNDRQTATINLVRAYGEAFQSSSRAPKHKCNKHTSTIFSLRLEFKWYSREFLGSSTLGCASGKIKIGEIDNQNFIDPSSWEATVNLDMESVPGMMQQPENAESPLEPSELESALKAKVVQEGLPIVLSRLKKFLQNHFGDDSKFEDLKNVPGNEIVEDKITAVEIYATPELTTLRRKLLGKEYLKVMDSSEENVEPVWQFRLCTINDSDVLELAEKAKRNTSLKQLDVYFNYITDKNVPILFESLAELPELELIDFRNNRIGDAGVQSILGVLALGGIPKLKSLDLRGNESISSVGETMLQGLALVRKSIKVLID